MADEGPFRMVWDGSDFELLKPGEYDENDVTCIEVDEADNRVRIIYGKRAKVSFIDKRMIERKVRTMTRAGFPHPLTKRRIYPGLKIVIEEEVSEEYSSVSGTPASAAVKTSPARSRPISPPVRTSTPEVSLKPEPPAEIKEIITTEARIGAVSVIEKELTSDMGTITAYEVGEILESYLEKGKTVLISKGEKGYRFIVMDIARDSFSFDLRKT
ncbi:MAG: hypothetical protein ACFFD4_12205 [Candidatus Odinarchaeota archaeon]